MGHQEKASLIWKRLKKRLSPTGARTDSTKKRKKKMKRLPRKRRRKRLKRAPRRRKRKRKRKRRSKASFKILLSASRYIFSSYFNLFSLAHIGQISFTVKFGCIFHWIILYKRNEARNYVS